MAVERRDEPTIGNVKWVGVGLRLCGYSICLSNVTNLHDKASAEVLFRFSLIFC